jgi:hypothetical protein
MSGLRPSVVGQRRWLLQYHSSLCHDPGGTNKRCESSQLRRAADSPYVVVKIQTQSKHLEDDIALVAA